MATEEVNQKQAQLRLIHWSFTGLDEHIAQYVKLSDMWLIVSQPVSIRKDIDNDQNKITTSFVKFCYSIHTPDDVTINMKNIAWYDMTPSATLVDSYRQYLYGEPAVDSGENTTPPGLEGATEEPTPIVGE